MKSSITIAVLALACGCGTLAHAQSGGDIPVAGRARLGVQTTEMQAVVAGWSARKNILGKAVYNEDNQRIGTIDDIIIAPGNAVSFAIIGAGGFLGLGKHDVAIPVDQIGMQDNNKFILPGATKDALKALPKFEYAPKQK